MSEAYNTKAFLDATLNNYNIVQHEWKRVGWWRGKINYMVWLWPNFLICLILQTFCKVSLKIRYVVLSTSPEVSTLKDTITNTFKNSTRNSQLMSRRRNLAWRHDHEFFKRTCCTLKREIFIGCRTKWTQATKQFCTFLHS